MAVSNVVGKVEEIADDGPLFLLRVGQSQEVQWNELPEPDAGSLFDHTMQRAKATDPDVPLYENHWSSAQRVWEQLQNRHVIKESTRQEPDGRQLHVELGQAEEGGYLYCANTLDQRQLVIVEPARRRMLESYYEEIMNGA